MAKAGPRGQNPGAATEASLRTGATTGSRDRWNSRRDTRRNGRWARVRREEGALTRDRGRTNTAKGDEQIPWTSPAARKRHRPGRENCPGAGPVRALSEEHQPRMTRTGDVSTATRDHCNRTLPRARGSKSSSDSSRRREARKPQGRRDRRLGCRRVATQTPKRDGPGGGTFRTARHGQ